MLDADEKLGQFFCTKIQGKLTAVVVKHFLPPTCGSRRLVCPSERCQSVSTSARSVSEALAQESLRRVCASTRRSYIHPFPTMPILSNAFVDQLQFTHAKNTTPIASLGLLNGISLLRLFS